MLRYYSYYSVGGYKDLMLGNNENKEEATYYFPLLPILEERAKNDTDAAKQVAELNMLPAIKQLSANNKYELPDSARVMFSHAGYKLIYKHLDGEKYAIALRDIPNTVKDEAGRSTPFLFVITSDTNADIRTMDILATYIAGNIKTTEMLLSQLLYMDADKNGLRFDLAKFNTWVLDIIKLHHSNSLPSISGGVKIHAYQNRVALLVLPKGITPDKAIKEQKISTGDIVMMKESEIISKEDPEKLVGQLLALAEELKSERKRNNLMKKKAIIAGVGGFVLGTLITGCCSK